MTRKPEPGELPQTWREFTGFLRKAPRAAQARAVLFLLVLAAIAVVACLAGLATAAHLG